MLTRAGVPSSEVERSGWPDNNGLAGSLTHEEQERAHRQRWEHAVWEHAHGYRKREPDPYQALPPPKPPGPERPLKTDEEREETARQNLASPVLLGEPLFEGPRQIIPKIWGEGLGAVDARTHGAEPRMSRNGKLHVGWDGGAERVSVKVVRNGIELREIQTVPSRPSDWIPPFTPREVSLRPQIIAEQGIRHLSDGRRVPYERVTIGANGKDLPVVADHRRTVKSVKVQLDGGRMNAVEGSPTVRGMATAVRLYQTHAIVGSVAEQAKPTGKVSVGKTKKVVSAKKARDLSAVSVKATVALSDLEFARLKRTILHRDAPRAAAVAYTAPAREIHAF